MRLEPISSRLHGRRVCQLGYDRSKAPLGDCGCRRAGSNCACIALPPDEAVAVARDRGYNDIDPEKCWEQWQVARKELLRESGGE